MEPKKITLLLLIHQNNHQPMSRVFLSSTAIDLQDHRQKVTEAILRLNNQPVKMEVFGARPNAPVEECKKEVANSDILVVMIAHRYGWIPTIGEGGDGKKSITWIEVETALSNGIPVLAFIVDNDHPWSQPKEQDQLTTTADPKKIADIVRSVQSLQEFKDYLNSKAGLIRDKFTSPDDLAMKVATSLANLAITPGQPTNRASTRPPYVFRVVHHLQPAPHFRGRKQLLKELVDWWHEPVTADRVRSLVAIGGTGKTALAERFIKTIETEPLRGSVLVWSFYDDPNTDSFLREACIIFTGVEPEGEGGKLEKLLRALAADNSQHLIVVDGLEMVQSEGKGMEGHAKGDLNDHRLKNLFRNIAAGELGNTRTLITTRFKLTDLIQWENIGYRSHELDVLDKDSAVEVLKAWGIKGDDEQLAKMAASAGNHALSVSVLGSYLNGFCNGDPNGAKEFNLDDVKDNDPQAAKLGRILAGYAKNLPERERDLLVRLSVFPKGVTIDILGYVVNAGGEIAGTLIGVTQHSLAVIAEKLKQQGLIYSYKKEKTIVYTSHPFLRQYFKKLLGVKSEDIHEVIRKNMVEGLDTRPHTKPTDPIILDRYEQLIEQSILAGHYQEAADIFWDAMGGGGGENHLFHVLNDYGRILRIVSLFSKDGTPATINDQLPNNDKAVVLNNWGFSAFALGDLQTAEVAFTLLKTNEKIDNQNKGLIFQNCAFVSISKGTFPAANILLNKSIDFLGKEPIDDFVEYGLSGSHAYLGYIMHLMGEISEAKQHFLTATEINKGILNSTSGILQIEHLWNLGQKEQAIAMIDKNLSGDIDRDHRDTILRHYFKSVITLPLFMLDARKCHQKLLKWTEKSGHMEFIIHADMLAAKIAYHSKDYPTAIAEATAGLNQADSCGFGKLAIDLLLQLSKIHLAIPDYKKALAYARDAYDRSAKPECSNAWGEANGAHLRGVCHKAMGEYELARKCFDIALKLRQKIQHPEVEETRKLLAELPPPKK